MIEWFETFMQKINKNILSEIIYWFVFKYYSIFEKQLIRDFLTFDIIYLWLIKMMVYNSNKQHSWEFGFGLNEHGFWIFVFKILRL